MHLIRYLCSTCVILLFTTHLARAYSSDAPQINPKKEWTFLIFLNADNNLDEAGWDDIQEMERVGADPSINVVVQFDTYRTSEGVKRIKIRPEAFEPMDPAEWYAEQQAAEEEASEEIEGEENTPIEEEAANTENGEVTVEEINRHSKSSPWSYNVPKVARAFRAEVIEEMPELNMGDWRELRDFVVWGMETYPAKHYMVTLWNHGSGWYSPVHGQPFRGISFDDTDRDHIDTAELGRALREINRETGNRIDVLSFDACLMSMIEVMTEVAPYTDYFLGSEEVEPFDGWAYDDFFSEIKNLRQRKEGRFGINPQTMTKALVSTYVASYDNGSQGKQPATQAAANLKYLPMLLQDLDHLVELIMSKRDFNRDVIRKVAKETQNYAEPDYKDLSDFLSLLIARTSMVQHPEIVTQAITTMRSLRRLVEHNAHAGSSVAKSRGVSIHLPHKSWWASSWTEFSAKREDYQGIEFSRLTLWDEFLDYLYLEKK